MRQYNVNNQPFDKRVITLREKIWYAITMEIVVEWKLNRISKCRRIINFKSHQEFNIYPKKH